MKHLLIALLTLALTLAFCVFACAQVRSEALTTLNTLRLAQIQAERQDYAAAADAVLSAGESWKAQERFFDIVLQHSEVDDVTTGFSSLYQYALLEDGDDFAASCAEMISKIQHIRQMQLPTFANIL
ncbi:putative uncharacterized protein [Firmicutes bacterium CAG:170]|jgi:predicted negative regulator of RcsB-dependent stress response|nr:putative uncharacterized protein [Firmicutes bacterium CAG:170]